MTLDPQTLKDSLEALSRPDITEISLKNGDVTLVTHSESIVGLLTFLRDDMRFRFIQLIDLCGVDYPSRVERFEVVYHLLSLHHNCRVRVKFSVAEDISVPSVVSVFPVADWNEREAFDMYGITFSGHPDMRRILTDYGFTGYPLRKDFPMTGYVEVRYDDVRKRVVYDPVTLTQDFRVFDFLSPWEGAKYALVGNQKTEQK